MVRLRAAPNKIDGPGELCDAATRSRVFQSRHGNRSPVSQTKQRGQRLVSRGRKGDENVRKKASIDGATKPHALDLRAVNLQPTRDAPVAAKDGKRLVDGRNLHRGSTFLAGHGARGLAYNDLQSAATRRGDGLMAKSGPPSLHVGQVGNRSKEAIGRRLKQVRTALGLTQEQIAKSIGSPQGTWGQYEAGMRKPSIAVASRLYDRYRISLDFIYLGDASKLPFDLDQKINWPKSTGK